LINPEIAKQLPDFNPILIHMEIPEIEKEDEEVIEEK